VKRPTGAVYLDLGPSVTKTHEGKKEKNREKDEELGVKKICSSLHRGGGKGKKMKRLDSTK